MGRIGAIAVILVTTVIVGGAGYLLFEYVTKAPSVRPGIVVIAGSAIAVGALVLVAQVASLRGRT
jgi:hypothetical protein